MDMQSQWLDGTPPGRDPGRALLSEDQGQGKPMSHNLPLAGLEVERKHGREEWT